MLEGERVRLEPLHEVRHLSDLWAAAHEGDPRLWDYLPYGPFADRDDFGRWLHGCAHAHETTDERFYAIVDAATGRAAGMLAYLRIAPTLGRIEIGHIWFGAALQRTPRPPRRSSCSPATPSTTWACVASSGSATR